MKSIYLLIPLLLLLTGCDNGESSTSDYEETKKMVIDMMQTDAGKEAIQQVMLDKTVQNELIMSQEAIDQTIKETLTSDEAKAFWKKAFKDPEFTASYAKGLEDEHKEILKSLMTDADYRSLLLEVLQEPKMEKELIKLIKSNDVRKELKETIIETVDSPLVLEKLQTILTESKPSDDSDEAEKTSQTQTGGTGGDSSGDSSEESSSDSEE